MRATGSHLHVRYPLKRGWYEPPSVLLWAGNHRHFRYPLKRGIVTVPGHMADDIHPKTLRSILRQAQLERER
jgi:predicted RNA binding protein YcfA (HicA-like mRNA interferase family)